MIYLDNAATTFPKPGGVPERVSHILTHVGGNPGRGGHKMSLQASRVVFETRELLARLIGAPDSSRVVFTRNATEAVNIALKGLLSPGDGLVISSFEHNSVVKTSARLASTGVDVTRVSPGPEGILDPSAVAEAITGKTRVVCVTHASNVFGTLQPVEEIARVCREKNVTFVVDAAQTAGAVPLDVAASEIDILVGTGHKGCLGPQGTGFMYVREGMELPPLVDGGTGEEDTVLEMPDRLEAGTMNTPGIGGLGAGIEFVLGETVEKVRKREKALTSMLMDGLSGIPGVEIIGAPDVERKVALVSFTMEGVAVPDAGDILDRDFDVMVRAGTHCAPEAHRTAGTFPEGTIRVSPGYFTTDAEIEAALEAIRGIARKGGRG